MPIKHMEEYRDAKISQRFVEKIRKISRRKVRLMEVCGTHTVSIFRSGVRSILPDTISLLSGPGCPVCVTDQREIDSFIELSHVDDVILTTFGDLMRTPGTLSTLQKERANGRDIRMVTSTIEAVEIAATNRNKRVVLAGVGFETTAPTIAASLLSAKQMGFNNFFVYSAHKLVPSALYALMSNEEVKIDGFILPGHVSVIIGTRAFQPFFNKYKMPCVISGFEPADILHAISMLVEQIENSRPKLQNAYGRAVTFEGNHKAQEMLTRVFKRADVAWRGMGTISQSGLKIRDEFAAYDAEKMFEINLPASEAPKGCACGEILTGTKIPPECSLYKKSCTQVDPVGPCMVTSEGTCAAYYRYHNR